MTYRQITNAQNKARAAAYVAKQAEIEELRRQTESALFNFLFDVIADDGDNIPYQAAEALCVSASAYYAAGN